MRYRQGFRFFALSFTGSKVYSIAPSSVIPKNYRFSKNSESPALEKTFKADIKILQTPYRHFIKINPINLGNSAMVNLLRVGFRSAREAASD
jgi:hypothetical protein